MKRSVSYLPLPLLSLHTHTQRHTNTHAKSVATSMADNTYWVLGTVVVCLFVFLGVIVGRKVIVRLQTAAIGTFG